MSSNEGIVLLVIFIAFVIVYLFTVKCLELRRQILELEASATEYLDTPAMICIMNERAHCFSVNNEIFDNSSTTSPARLHSSFLIPPRVTLSPHGPDSIPLVDLPPAYSEIIKDNVDVEQPPPSYISQSI